MFVLYRNGLMLKIFLLYGWQGGGGLGFTKWVWRWENQTIREQCYFWQTNLADVTFSSVWQINAHTFAKFHPTPRGWEDLNPIKQTTSALSTMVRLTLTNSSYGQNIRLLGVIEFFLALQIGNYNTVWYCLRLLISIFWQKFPLPGSHFPT